MIAVTLTAAVAATDQRCRPELPAAFIELMEGSGLPDTSGLLEALASGDPVVAVRLNRGKGASAPLSGSGVAWCPDGYRLDDRPQFTFDPAFHQGLYYVQDPSSMVVGHIVGRLVGDMCCPLCLDACAAPGGKTTSMLGALPAGAFVVANEYVPSRAAVLRDNVMKWDSVSTAVSQGPVKPLGKLREMFDLILADVPCSGEGMMRQDDEAVSQWTPALVGQCASLQRDIVA
ncbi:MAG: rRNA cytosine-C5-methylase, partial [Muribaculaceae bacterium]|nr:rRNA cytosine-C5-methylase [Muribaculaceae bacterium]